MCIHKLIDLLYWSFEYLHYHTVDLWELIFQLFLSYCSLRHASTASCSRLTSSDATTTSSTGQCLDAPFANIDTSSVTSMDCLDIDLLVKNAVEKHHAESRNSSQVNNNNSNSVQSKILLPTEPLSRSSLNPSTLRNSTVAIVPQSSVIQLGSNNLKVEMEVLDPYSTVNNKKASKMNSSRRSRNSSAMAKKKRTTSCPPENTAANTAKNSSVTVESLVKKSRQILPKTPIMHLQAGAVGAIMTLVTATPTSLGMTPPSSPEEKEELAKKAAQAAVNGQPISAVFATLNPLPPQQNLTPPPGGGGAQLPIR